MPPVRRSSASQEKAKVRSAVDELEEYLQQATSLAFDQLDGHLREEQIVDPIDLVDGVQRGKSYVDGQIQDAMQRARNHFAEIVVGAVQEAEARSAKRYSPPEIRPAVRDSMTRKHCVG